VRRAFTLIELVVVILILGILAAVAAPRAVQVSGSAKDNSVRHTLCTVRDAIDAFTARNGRLPGDDGNEATFKLDLTPYLREFPAAPVGPAPNATVLMTSGGSLEGDAAPTEGWKYFFDTGRFIINLHEKVETDSSIFYDEL
jgi:general secretion pathway protein G